MQMLAFLLTVTTISYSLFGGPGDRNLEARQEDAFARSDVLASQMAMHHAAALRSCPAVTSCAPGGIAAPVGLLGGADIRSATDGDRVVTVLHRGATALGVESGEFQALVGAQLRRQSAQSLFVGRWSAASQGLDAGVVAPGGGIHSTTASIPQGTGGLTLVEGQATIVHCHGPCAL